MSDVTEPLFFNPLQEGYMEDPYTHMAEIRDADPAHFIFDRWGLFRYDDCFTLLRDASLSVDDNNTDLQDGERAVAFREALAAEGLEIEPEKSMLGLDAPDHTRLRRLVQKAFTPRSIEKLRVRVQELVDQRLDVAEAAGHMDVVADLAFPLPFDVISEMLGMPEADREAIKEWSGHMVKTLDPIVTDEEVITSVKCSRLMNAHIREVIAWKRENPGDDLLTRMIEAEEDGDRMSTEELVAQITLLFIAGHETTVNLIGTGVFELMRNPEQLALLRDNPDLDANAVDELLRYISPVQISRRIATAEIEFSGTTIPERGFIFAILASANRDPDKFGPTANQLDVTRADAGQHLSFGSGSHYCLGASLAKMEAQVAIGTLIRRFPNMAANGAHEWNGRLNLRGLETLPITVG